MQNREVTAVYRISKKGLDVSQQMLSVKISAKQGYVQMHVSYVAYQHFYKECYIMFALHVYKLHVNGKAAMPLTTVSIFASAKSLDIF